MKVKVNLECCEDDNVFDIDCTKEQYEFLKQVEEISKEKSEWSGMPVMLVDVHEETGE